MVRLLWSTLVAAVVGAGGVAAGGERGERAGARTSRLCPNLRGVEWVLVTRLCEHGGEHGRAIARSSPGSVPCRLQLSMSVRGLKRKKVLDEQPEGCVAHRLPHLCSLIWAQSPGKTGGHPPQRHSPGARAPVSQWQQRHHKASLKDPSAHLLHGAALMPLLKYHTHYPPP